MEAAIRRGLGETVTIHYWSWSRRNSFFSRYLEGNRLESLLVDLVADANRSVYLVGHSHGGTIALLALNNRDLSRRIRLVITLGTPFITAAQNHDLTEMTRSAGKVLPIAALIISHLLSVPNTVLLGITAVTAFACRAGGVYDRFIDRWIAFGNETSAAMKLPDSELAPVCILRFPSDETALALIAARLVTRGMTWLVRTVSQLDARIATIVHRIPDNVHVALVAALLIAARVTTGDVATLTGVVAAAYAFVFWGPPLLIAFLAACAGALQAPAGGVALIPVGPMLELETDVTPPGNWNTELLRAQDCDGLRHSCARTSARALGQVEAWLLEAKD